MTNEQLKAFVAVVDKGSFRAAAEHLFKTQPTISASVLALEEQFSVTLLNRDGYRPVLTDAGKTFYRQAKKLLSRVGELERLGYDLATGAAPTLAISLSALCDFRVIVELMQRFSTAHEPLELRMTTERLSGVLEQLHKGKADIAIGPHKGLDDRYEFVEVTRMVMITVAAPGYLNAGPRGVVSQDEARQRPNILLSDSGSVSPFDHWNVIAGGARWYVSDYPMKRSLVLKRMGWSRIPLHLVEEDIANGLLERIEIEDFISESQVPLNLIRLKDQPRTDLARQLWEQLYMALNRR